MIWDRLNMIKLNCFPQESLEEAIAAHPDFPLINYSNLL